MHANVLGAVNRVWRTADSDVWRSRKREGMYQELVMRAR